MRTILSVKSASRPEAETPAGIFTNPAPAVSKHPVQYPIDPASVYYYTTNMADVKLIEYREKAGRIRSAVAVVEVLGWEGLLPAEKIGNSVAVTGIGVQYPRGRKVWNAKVVFSMHDPERFTVLPPILKLTRNLADPNIVGFISQVPVDRRSRRGRYVS
jgi:hypothetical protein